MDIDEPSDRGVVVGNDEDRVQTVVFVRYVVSFEFLGGGHSLAGCRLPGKIHRRRCFFFFFFFFLADLDFH